MLEVVARTAEQLFIPLTVGGGLRSVEEMRQMLKAGADKVSINTAAVEAPGLIRRGADAFYKSVMGITDSSPVISARGAGAGRREAPQHLHRLGQKGQRLSPTQFPHQAFYPHRGWRL